MAIFILLLRVFARILLREEIAEEILFILFVFNGTPQILVKSQLRGDQTTSALRLIMRPSTLRVIARNLLREEIAE